MDCNERKELDKKLKKLKKDYLSFVYKRDAVENTDYDDRVQKKRDFEDVLELEAKLKYRLIDLEEKVYETKDKDKIDDYLYLEYWLILV